jgi:hypothetical protein
LDRIDYSVKAIENTSSSSKQTIPIQGAAKDGRRKPDCDDWRVIRKSGVRKSRAAAIRYLARLKPGERVQARSALDALAVLLGGADALSFAWEVLTPELMPSPELLRSRFGHSLLSRVKRSLNGVLREAVYLGGMSSVDYAKLCRVSWNKVRVDPWTMAGLSWPGVEPLFAVCVRDGSAVAIRDAALFGLIWSEQFRLTEAICFPSLKSTVRWGRSSFVRPLPALVTESLMRWHGIRGSDDGPFLYKTSQGGAIFPARMSTDLADAIFHRRSGEASIARVKADELRQASIRYHCLP